MTNAIRVRVGCEFGFVSSAPAHSVIQVEPHRTDRTSMLQELWSFTPEVHRRGYRDGYGNLCQRVDAPAGPLTVRYDAIVAVPPELDDADETAHEVAPSFLPDDVLVYTLPSRYCLSDELADAAWQLFGTVPPGWGRVQAICDWVHTNITFEHGASSPRTTAADVYRSRRGVCRDFAQLAISFCRAMNIPTRYAFGYIPDIDVPPDGSLMDFAAWMEVWLGGRWYTFDPRNNHRRIGRVVIGRGRDALDCAMLTTYGDSTLVTMTVWADEVPAGTVVTLQ
ncbi:MAG: transglutaminase family protein [bacterium]